MWKVLIADDEPKIRQGLRNTLEQFRLPLEVCAEARNGIQAIEEAKKHRPEILLVDICMPKLSGIQFLQELKKTGMDYKVIIISGYNEFSYAKQAISLGVSGYLLKPIEENELKEGLEALIHALQEEQKTKRYMEMAQQKNEKSLFAQKEEFFQKWLDGVYSDEEWIEQQTLLNLQLPKKLTLVYLGIPEGHERPEKEKLREALKKALKNSELQDIPFYIAFAGEGDMVMCFEKTHIEHSGSLMEQLRSSLAEQINLRGQLQLEIGRTKELLRIYEVLKENSRKLKKSNPMVREARHYIREHFGERELDLTTVADAIGCNPSYLSRIMRQDLGTSFKDYLTSLRIKRAVDLMQIPEMSLNEIAERVGYSNQHYFSAAFKNSHGVAPSEYRKKLLEK